MRAVPLTMMLLLVTWLAVGQAPAPAQVVSGKLGVVDGNRVLTESEEGKAYQAELRRKFGPRQKKIQELAAEMDKLQSEYRQRQTALSGAERQQRALEIQRKQKEAERLNEDLNYDLNAAREEGLGRLRGRLQEVVNRYGKEKQYTAIFDAASAGTMYAGPGVDLTNEILAVYNQQFPVKPETQQYATLTIAQPRWRGSLGLAARGSRRSPAGARRTSAPARPRGSGRSRLGRGGRLLTRCRCAGIAYGGGSTVSGRCRFRRLRLEQGCRQRRDDPFWQLHRVI